MVCVEYTSWIAYQIFLFESGSRTAFYIDLVNSWTFYVCKVGYISKSVLRKVFNFYLNLANFLGARKLNFSINLSSPKKSLYDLLTVKNVFWKLFKYLAYIKIQRT